MTIRSGTFIRIGENPSISVEARGMLIKIINDTNWGKRASVEVIEDPSGFYSGRVSHYLNHRYDKIEYRSNAQSAEGGLDKI